MKHKSVEQVIKERQKTDREELERLRKLKRNLESGIVFNFSSKLIEILETYETKDL